MLSSKTIEKIAIEKFGNNFIRYKVDEWLFPCPKCKKHNIDNLHVSLSKGKYHCFHCDYGGSFNSVNKLSDVINNEKVTSDNKKQKNNYLIPFVRKELTEEQLNALYNRKLTNEDIKYYNICGGKRIQIPNYILGSLTDMVCMWEWRKDKVTKYNPKYLYPKEVKTHDTVFNIHNIKENENIILCEGIFNAITAGKNAVASYGCHLSNTQLDLILNKKPKKITIAYDSDIPGVEGSIDVITKLHNVSYEGDVEYILLPKNVDINDMGREKFLNYYVEKRIKLYINNLNLSKKIPKLAYSAI